jgi:hypothetical protein
VHDGHLLVIFLHGVVVVRGQEHIFSDRFGFDPVIFSGTFGPLSGVRGDSRCPMCNWRRAIVGRFLSAHDLFTALCYGPINSALIVLEFSAALRGVAQGLCDALAACFAVRQAGLGLMEILDVAALPTSFRKSMFL